MKTTNLLVHGYLAEILGTPGEYLEYREDALCCSADFQLTFEPYDPYADEVEMLEEYLDEDEEEQSCYHHVNNHTRSVSSKYNNDLYSSNEVEGNIYYKIKDEDMKLERTDRKYPLRSNLTKEEAVKTIYVPVQVIMPRVFTKNDQYGISSPRLKDRQQFQDPTREVCLKR